MSGSGYGSDLKEFMDPDPVCPERLDPDPVNIRPDPQPCLVDKERSETETETYI